MTIQIGEVFARCLALLFSQPIEFFVHTSSRLLHLLGLLTCRLKLSVELPPKHLAVVVMVSFDALRTKLRAFKVK